jgi:hypothetical protein
MKLFACQRCGNALFFDNRDCLRCGARVAYVPDLATMSALEPDGTGGWSPLAEPGRRVLLCQNAGMDVCNWVVDGEAGLSLCEACRHNHTIPDLAVPGNLERWRKIELAKRRLFYSLLRWNLRAPDRTEDPSHGLAFDFLGDVETAAGAVEPVMTGHDSGLITINIAEADDAEREKRRAAMGEPYRTLLGHLRHEVGHYVWDRLVSADPDRLQHFRALFGDEREDYGEALKRHYAQGPRPDWVASCITAYASSHPWEDFAESFAHFVHIVDTLETAKAFGLKVESDTEAAADLSAGVPFDPYRAESAEQLVRAWVPVTVAVNAINRSMGQPDLYPFVLAPPVVEKLEFIRALLQKVPAPAA